jgi:Protein of unknown function (DUF2637)
MTDMPAHARLTSKQRQALALAVTVVIAGMAMGFLSSFTTLYKAAEQHAWVFPWLLPLSVDSGILAYVVLDHLAVTLGSRSRWLHLAAWALAAFTVWANAAVSPSDGMVWRVIHAAMPALWVLGVEALRFTWKRLHEDPDAKPAGIPAGRYLAAPLATPRMRRRMWLANETSYPRAVAMEDARLHARDLIRAAAEGDSAPAVPAALRRAVRSGRLPAAVVSAVDSGMTFGGASQWEPAVATWVTSSLTLSERLSAQLQGARRDIARAALPVPIGSAPPEPVQDALRDASQKTPADTPQKPSGSAVQRVRRKGGRKATDEEIREAIRELFTDGDSVTKYRVMKALPVGEPRAERLLAEVQSERAPLARVK